MFVEDPEQGLQVEAVATTGAILEMQAVTAKRPERLGQRLAIARQENVISHLSSPLLNGARHPADQNGRKTCRTDIDSRIRFCSALIAEPSTITMSPA